MYQKKINLLKLKNDNTQNILAIVLKEFEVINPDKSSDINE